MKVEGNGRLQLSATDLSNHIACGHLTTLGLAYARKQITGYTNFDPLLKILQERGRVHEDAYTAHLRASGKRIESGGNQTLALMARGLDVITQATLQRGPWFGRADFLVRVERPSAEWAWSYEVIDTKLSSETRAGAVLQLCVYSDLLATLQGIDPEAMHVVRPGPDFPMDSFRFDEYAAIYRALRHDLEQRITVEHETYPEPTAHCDTCNWRDRCDGQRRADDHLSLVADLGRTHRRELDRHAIRTLTSLAQAPSPWPHRPERGSLETYQRLAQQARLQLAAKGRAVPPFELLATETERGLGRLPAPDDGDVFLDFEGDPFIGEHGREYLFGFYTRDRGYEALWALDDDSERAALDRFFTFVMARWEAHPGMHVYHYAPYEPTALKRLVGRYGLRMQELDRLLRGRRLVDLYSITRQAARIGVESYSIKHLEPLIGYQRPVPLAVTGPDVRALRVCLQRGLTDAIEPAWRTSVEAYNRGDCESTLALRDWLETQRASAGITTRPELATGEPEAVSEVRTAAAETALRLLEGVSPNRDERDEPQQARWLLGHLMEWYRREASVTWWDYYRLLDASDDERLDDLRAIAGLEHVSRTEGRRVPTDVYRYPAQDVFIAGGESLIAGDKLRLGTVVTIDPGQRTIAIKKTLDSADLHPSSVFAHKLIPPGAKNEALVALGQAVVANGFPPDAQPSLARDLLRRHPPRAIAAPGQPLRRGGEAIVPCAIRLVLELNGTVLPIQGPPGTGKTSTAAEMILALVRAGRRVGVTATSHAVIENLVRRAVDLGNERGQPLVAALKCDEDDDSQHPNIRYVSAAKQADELVSQLQLLGATAWQWARSAMRDTVDVLFIDEAGQMCLADAIAVCGSTRNLVLVGDPQQLEQPIQGTHPDGVGVSVLQHMLGDAQTIAPDRGLLLDQTHRLHPSICAFTSEQFYERQLSPGPDVATQALSAGPLTRAGLYWRPIAHAGNQNRSREEATAVAELVAACLAPGATWTTASGARLPLTTDDVLIVAPYNAHVAAVREALAAHSLADVRVGTVDKFQGQEAAIAIYTMATSLPEDAPRGLGFLYDRHRLNVATSRARCAAVLVCSPALLRPACSTPTHLHLASALARYVELAQPLDAMPR